ncbi:hypothetical protein BGX30_014425 [Mortierella sp. GBA39]|nr:hypothetical protein BGX30_014425 [Mortierella sp. GBA39]
MTKSTTLLLALALLAPLFIATSPVQAAPIPPSPSSQHSKRGVILDHSGPMITALSPFANMVGQGLQAQSSQLAGAAQDAGSSIKKQTDRTSDITQQSLSGAGQEIVNSPANVRGVTQAAPLV